MGDDAVSLSRLFCFCDLLDDVEFGQIFIIKW